MVFIDNLAYLLFALGFVSLLILYMTVSVFLSYRKPKKVDMYDTIKGGMLPIGLLGVYLFVMSVVGQLTWPLPGSYNILFFDPLTSLSIVLIGFAYSIRARLKMHYVGLLSFFAGCLTIFYGVNGYFIGLTQSPIVFVTLFMAFGAVGILAFPISLIMDLEPGKNHNHHSMFWGILLILFWIALIVAALLAFMVGGAAVAPHLKSAP